MSKSSRQFDTIVALAARLYDDAEADAMMFVLDTPPNWETLREIADTRRVIVASDVEATLADARGHELPTVLVELHDAPVLEKLAQALLESVSDELLEPAADVVAVYSGFQAGTIDSISYLRLDEHLGKLTARDLRRLETSVPLETLKVVMDLAVEIGREGREGKRVGTMFVVGDTRKVLSMSQPAGYDPVRGYSRKERELRDPRVREAVKEVAPLDGAFIITADGVVEKACQLVESAHANITMSKGLGSRHWAGAAISKNTKAVAIVVSESNGTVRLFQNGEVLLRVEPFRRAMKWKDFEYEPPPTAPEA